VREEAVPGLPGAVRARAAAAASSDRATAPRLTLKSGREKSLLRRHPWIFSGAVAGVEGQPAAGEMLPVMSAQGAFLAWAAYNPNSQIVGRVWSWQQERAPGPALLRELLAAAIQARATLLPDLCAVRLVHGESDRLPGVVVDRYDGVLVLQLTSAGADRLREAIVDALVELTGLPCVFERSDAEVLELEGLPVRVGPLRGAAPVGPLVVEEHGLHFSVSVERGHKTGFYLDQRDNRRLVRAHAARREVLDCFCYTGGFALNALAGGARSVLAVDSSGDALRVARHNAQLNAAAPERVQWLEGDVFQALRRLRDQARTFDLIVLDPPKFAPTAALAERAARAYKDINLLAFKLLRPGGLLFTFSCSGGMPRELFRKIVAGAALDAGVPAQIVHHLDAAPDHPVALEFPEGEYLKGLLCRVA
jgi:23S rRNA (cytosine1962-C5)-methyltransferase